MGLQHHLNGDKAIHHLGALRKVNRNIIIYDAFQFYAYY